MPSCARFSRIDPSDSSIPAEACSPQRVYVRMYAPSRCIRNGIIEAIGVHPEDLGEGGASRKPLCSFSRAHGCAEQLILVGSRWDWSGQQAIRHLPLPLE